MRDQKNSAPQPAGESADSPAEADSASGPEKLPAISDQRSGESASASEAGEKQKQEKQLKNRSFHERISDLTSRLKTAEEGRVRLERELEDLRKGVRSPEARQQPQQASAVSDQRSAEGEPDFEALLDTAINDPANTTYEKAQAAALRAYHKAIREAEGKRAERERAETQSKTAHEGRLAKTRERHGDFDEVVAAAIPQVEGVHNPGIEAAMAASDSAEVVYYFATHLDEFRRIAQMKPQAAYRATVALDLKLGQSTPEKTASAPRQASRAPAPITPVTGSTAHTPKSPAEARDYGEYKRLRTAGR
ncbi:MAG TPA: hypothetical protein VIY49_29575 [Bryobacteraceae bacterium]